MTTTPTNGITMTLDEAKAIAELTHKGTDQEFRLTYGKIFAAVQILMLEELRNNGRRTSSALYAATGANFNLAIEASIRGLHALVKAGKVTDEHEMLDGYISTHFHRLAI